ncbi:threonine/serine exporter family protein [Bifidobacterium sp. 82T24]|uniref:threonine/serine ThrE exporter family protein n=1 Tax=Bifidobacterium pluvialisilvae TaxID=2834436 RepID=UPI001C563880|nr:threonine/serine exporter family protein [Bifidobacterium pluvialisilvae]MBW3088703.1 threonine/serine exporter family protein [Bifidobacterium pluvialisilvae]
MEDIERDLDKPVMEAGIAAKTSVIVRVGMLDLGAGTGSFRVRQMMHRIAYPVGVHVRADVNLTDIEASCTDGKNRVTEVIDLPTTGVNTERIWLLEHFADWFSVNLGHSAVYHNRGLEVSDKLVENLDAKDVSQVSAKAAKELRLRKKLAKEGTADTVSDTAPVPDGSPMQTTTATTKAERLHELDRQRDIDADDPIVRQMHASDPAKNTTNHDGTAPTSARKPRKSPKVRNHQPPKGKYAQHFDHVGKLAPNASDPNFKPITVREAHKRLDLIEHRKPLYTPAFAGLASALACASFVFLLGGGLYDMAGAFVGAGIGHWLRRKLFAKHLNQFFVTFVAVFIAALACTGTLRLIGIYDPIALAHDTAYIGAMLFVIPGFPLITGGLDIAKIDFPSGIQRLAYALSIILMATLAGWAVARIVMLNPQGFEPQGLNVWVTGLLRFVFAFIGVWGFSVMFNSPQRMCLVAAIIGAITDTTRLEFTDLLNMPPEVATFIGAFLAGLLAAAWRTAVRRGILPPHLGYPRICLTVPSIVIMVPGMYMYRAMFYLGQFNTQSALDWAFRAFMVIICLPIGLAMARVVTDRSWRYDI